MAQIQINTSQNVNVTFTLASVGERLAAFILDFLIMAAFILLTYYIFFNILDLSELQYRLDSWSFRAVIILLMLPAYVYTFTAESLMEGQTFGKKALKIKVVKIDGYQANFGDYLMRWVFRLIDVWSNGGAVGLISMIVSRNNQRLGDIATGTAVISLKNRINISHTILENLDDTYIPTFSQVIMLTDNDVRIIKETYQRAVRINDQQVIEKLAEKIQTTIKLEKIPVDTTYRKFIQTVLSDFNYFTGNHS